MINETLIDEDGIVLTIEDTDQDIYNLQYFLLTKEDAQWIIKRLKSVLYELD